jgi:hypothetical protein
MPPTAISRRAELVYQGFPVTRSELNAKSDISSWGKGRGSAKVMARGRGAKKRSE